MIINRNLLRFLYFLYSNRPIIIMTLDFFRKIGGQEKQAL